MANHNRIESRTPNSTLVYITKCVPPAVLIAAFYALRDKTVIMDAVGQRFALPVRTALARFFSGVSFSAAELLISLAIAWAAIFLAGSIISFFKARRNACSSVVVVAARGTVALWEPMPHNTQLVKRLLTLAAAALYLWCGFCWLWGSAYYETGLAGKNGFVQSGAAVTELLRVTRVFLDNANDLAPLVPRDAEGHFAAHWEDYVQTAPDAYKNVSLHGTDTELYAPKPMFYSKLMSRLSFTGFYFAFTGEANVNIDAPGYLIPATMAHELAHQCGYAAEEEANFLAIAACVTSGDTVYAYSGYMMGLIYLMNALRGVDFPAYLELNLSFCDELRLDFNDNNEYWQAQRTVEATGVEIIDNTLTAVTGAAEEAVTAFYDGYLKSYGQELGLRSYGACVDLLVEWYGKEQ